jgi:hypothetical protein
MQTPNDLKRLRKCFDEMKALGAPMIFHGSQPHPTQGFRDEFIISAETGNSGEWLNYSNESAALWGGDTINPELAAIADRHGVTIEWADSGHAKLYIY